MPNGALPRMTGRAGSCRRERDRRERRGDRPRRSIAGSRRRHDRKRKQGAQRRSGAACARPRRPVRPTRLERTKAQAVTTAAAASALTSRRQTSRWTSARAGFRAPRGIAWQPSRCARIPAIFVAYGRRRRGRPRGRRSGRARSTARISSGPSGPSSWRSSSSRSVFIAALLPTGRRVALGRKAAAQRAPRIVDRLVQRAAVDCIRSASVDRHVVERPRPAPCAGEA